MKTPIIALIILSSVLGSVITVSALLSRVLDRLSDTVSDGVPTSFTDALSEAEGTEKQYLKIRPFLALFTRDDEVREIEMYIEDIKSAAEEGDSAALATAKSRLKLHVGQLKRLSKFSIEATF